MGPLAGVRVLEVGGIGPNPFAGMLLADMGAEVIRLDRDFGTMLAGSTDPTLRGRQTLAVDLKSPAGREAALTLAQRADGLIEGFRPGVMERLGLGPEEVRARNRRLVYARMTGFGQDGPMAAVAGHDINYISVAGALGAFRRRGERPMFPVNLVGDYGGGAMLLAFGVVCGVLEARSSGQGQVIDVAMVDGVTLMLSLLHGMRAAGEWTAEPGTNLLDSGAHFYEVYPAADGGHIAVGCLEPKFYSRLLELLGIPEEEMPQYERARWPEFKDRLAAVFLTRTAQEWGTLLEGEETCATIVRTPFEAATHPHLAARNAFVELDGLTQPAPAPRFSRTPGQARPAARDPAAALEAFGLSPEECASVLNALSAGP